MIKKIAITALASGIKMLISRTDWDQVLSCVYALLDSTLDGSEKRQMAIDMARAVGVKAGNNLLNIAIEIAVLKLRNA